MTTRIRTALQHSGIVLVTTKNKLILPKMQEFIDQYISTSTRAIIFDDEADQASLNTFANSDMQSKLSEVSASIVKLRDYFPKHVYVQVTATLKLSFYKVLIKLFVQISLKNLIRE